MLEYIECEPKPLRGSYVYDMETGENETTVDELDVDGFISVWYNNIGGFDLSAARLKFPLMTATSSREAASSPCTLGNVTMFARLIRYICGRMPGSEAEPWQNSTFSYRSTSVVHFFPMT